MIDENKDHDILIRLEVKLDGFLEGFDKWQKTDYTPLKEKVESNDRKLIYFTGIASVLGLAMHKISNFIIGGK